MEKILLMYNPQAGDTLFKRNLDHFLEVFNQQNYAVEIFRSTAYGQMRAYLKSIDLTSIKAIFVAGGDGTVNEAVNTLMQFDERPALGVLPAGTCNDFARGLGLNIPMENAIDAIGKLQIQPIDVGMVNGRYFINVCGCGLFMNVSYNIDPEIKNMFGPFAYYVTGASQLPAAKPFRLHIETYDEVYESQFLLFAILNTEGAGGFQLAPGNILDDGMYEFVGIKTMPVTEFANVFKEILQKTHLKNPHVLHIKSDYFKITSNDMPDVFVESDIDGESGPKMPLEIHILPKAINIVTNL